VVEKAKNRGAAPRQAKKLNIEEVSRQKSEISWHYRGEIFEKLQQCCGRI
jgi:hypothetical protein